MDDEVTAAPALPEQTDPEPEVAICADLATGALEELFGRWQISVDWVGDGEVIPGSHWGGREAGMIGATLYVRRDTPVHSALHEGAHLICMGPERRATVNTDAEGEELEECGACVLQILLADELPAIGRERLMGDMDAWGYSFRLGSTRAWFENDAEDAWRWLEQAGLLREGVPVADPSAGAHRLTALGPECAELAGHSASGNIPNAAAVGQGASAEVQSALVGVRQEDPV